MRLFKCFFAMVLISIANIEVAVGANNFVVGVQVEGTDLGYMKTVTQSLYLFITETLSYQDSLTIVDLSTDETYLTVPSAKSKNNAKFTRANQKTKSSLVAIAFEAHKRLNPAPSNEIVGFNVLNALERLRLRFKPESINKMVLISDFRHKADDIDMTVEGFPSDGYITNKSCSTAQFVARYSQRKDFAEDVFILTSNTYADTEVQNRVGRFWCQLFHLTGANLIYYGAWSSDLNPILTLTDSYRDYTLGEGISSDNLVCMTSKSNKTYKETNLTLTWEPAGNDADLIVHFNNGVKLSPGQGLVDTPVNDVLPTHSRSNSLRKETVKGLFALGKDVQEILVKWVSSDANSPELRGTIIYDDGSGRSLEKSFVISTVGDQKIISL